MGRGVPILTERQVWGGCRAPLPELFLSFRFRSDSDSFSRFLALYKFVCIVCMIFVKIEWFN